METVQINVRIPKDLHDFISDTNKFKTITLGVTRGLQLLKSVDENCEVLSDSEILKKISNLVDVLKNRKTI